MPRSARLWHAVGAMFISVKRHEREKQELLAASNRLTDAILKTSALGLFLMDSKGKIQPQVSASLGELFRRQDFANLTVEKLIGPLVSAKTLTVVRSYMAQLLEGGKIEDNPLADVEVKVPGAEGGSVAAHYSFEFSAVDNGDEARSWMVRGSELT